MNSYPIHDEAEYRAALKEASDYFDNEPEPGTKDAARFEVLLTQIQAYEGHHFPVGLPDATEP